MKTIIYLLILQIISIKSSYVAPLYAQWAHNHIVWINGWQQDEQKFLRMIQNYQKYDIKVGGALIDANWQTQQNNFQWNYKKFPHPQAIVQTLHSKGIRLFLWVTSMFNNPQSKIYKQAKTKNYLLNYGKVTFVHSGGAFLDYLNPHAVQWWHQLMDKVLNIGVDGFKCDGTDPIAFLLLFPYSPYAKRYLYKHQYGHLYYGDFYNYTKSKTQYGLIMARPTDSYKTYASWNYSPKYVMFAGWVGDQDSSAEGLKKAMYNILKSAWNGYLNFGFDIGGYRGQNISKNIFIRWVQIGALLPFMENGGNGKHQPWLFDQQAVSIYRQFVDIHYQLKPTFLTCGYQKYQLKKSVITPLAKKIGQDSLKLPQTYSYLLCDNLLVSPIFQQNGQAQVIFPKGSNWLYYFDIRKLYHGGQSGYFTFKLSQMALFIKTNSVIVLEDEILIVAINPQYKINTVFLHGGYSDQFQLIYDGNTMFISINRFYKDPQVSQREKMYVNVKVIGFRENGYDGNRQGDGTLKYSIMVNDGIKTIENVQLLEKYKENVDHKLEE